MKVIKRRVTRQDQWAPTKTDGLLRLGMVEHGGYVLANTEAARHGVHEQTVAAI